MRCCTSTHGNCAQFIRLPAVVVHDGDVVIADMTLFVLFVGGRSGWRHQCCHMKGKLEKLLIPNHSPLSVFAMFRVEVADILPVEREGTELGWRKYYERKMKIFTCGGHYGSNTQADPAGSRARCSAGNRSGLRR